MRRQSPEPTDGPIVTSPLHPAALGLTELLDECDVRFTRRGGPGGQNRNKVETAAILTHRPSGLMAEASERRSQSENRRVALHRLRLALARSIRRPIDPDQPPSARWQSRSRGGRIGVNPSHEDFPALLAEALDQLDATVGDPSLASKRLGCTPSQLIKLVKADGPAFAAWNAGRRARGEPPLH
jgi:hypothetical protein